jgi:DNA-directed RNA polymerase specialized sigma24 family protein
MAHRSDSRRHHREREAGTIGVAATPIDGTVDVWDALNRLNVDERAVVFLTYWEDLTEPETAGRLEVSERTVRRRLGRARHKLGRLLDE